MKATGIVRRIDDLGRVVIPKEIRRTMRIREGDPLEIYTSSDGEVIFKKYSAINEMAQSASQVAEVMTKLAASEDADTLAHLCGMKYISNDAIAAAITAAISHGWTKGVAAIIRWRNDAIKAGE